MNLDSILKISPDPSFPKRGKNRVSPFTKGGGTSPPFGKACLPVGRGGWEGFYKDDFKLLKYYQFYFFISLYSFFFLTIVLLFSGRGGGTGSPMIFVTALNLVGQTSRQVPHFIHFS